MHSKERTLDVQEDYIIVCLNVKGVDGMKKLLVERCYDFVQEEKFTKLFLNKTNSKRVYDELNAIFPQDNIEFIVSNYYHVVRRFQEEDIIPDTNELIVLKPDVFTLEPNKESVRVYGYALPVIGLVKDKSGSVCYFE